MAPIAPNGNGLPSSTNTKIFVAAVMFCALLTVASMLILAIFKPGDTSTGTLILGVMSPITMALLAAAVYGVYHATNSRLTQLLDVTASANLAEGKRLGPDSPAPKE